jgi:hypothetical protein|tara:strand:- start:1037 stop:1651 length:615 start_codon:yes stop_codon:yes gene_type:complete
MIPKVTPFEVYQKYLSLKQHFNKTDYDFFKFKGKVRASESSFEKRKDKHHFIRLSKIYKEEELTKFLVSNFVKTSDLWVGNITSPEGRENYIAWKAKIQSLPYVFQNEIDEIFDDTNEFNELFECVDGQHPPVLRSVFGGDLSIESFIIMDSILRFSSTFNEKIEESVMWPNLYSMCLKYAPFLIVNKQKYVDILKKQVELHYV